MVERGAEIRDDILYYCYYYNVGGMRPHTFRHKDERLLYYHQRLSSQMHGMTYT